MLFRTRQDSRTAKSAGTCSTATAICRPVLSGIQGPIRAVPAKLPTPARQCRTTANWPTSAHTDIKATTIRECIQSIDMERSSRQQRRRCIRGRNSNIPVVTVPDAVGALRGPDRAELSHIPLSARPVSGIEKKSASHATLPHPKNFRNRPGLANRTNPRNPLERTPVIPGPRGNTIAQAVSTTPVSAGPAEDAHGTVRLQERG